VSTGVGSLEARVADVAETVIGRRPAPEERLELDSLGHAELLFALEEAFAVRLPDHPVPRDLNAAARAIRGAGERRRDAGLLPERIGHLQWLGQGVLGPVLRGYYRLTVTGTEGFPASGPVVLASNHDSLLDIPLIVIAAPRPVWFMAKRELFASPFGAWFFRVLGGFSVNRGANDMRAVRAALAVLRRGRVLGMYPEGTRSRSFLPFLPGAAWAALATGAPLVPAGISGTAESMPRGSKVPRPSRVRVRFGEPIRVAAEHDPRARIGRASALTGDLRAEIERLRSS